MKQRLLSICTALALCLGLLPVTALADGVNAPNTLYVGGTLVSSNSDGGYWTTDAQGKLTESTANDNWNVKYEPSTATLTLKGAKISGSYHQYNNPYTAGIYAQGSSNQPVTLTIELIGENTITGTFGIYVNAEINASSYGTNATLTITGENNGSLGVSGSNHGIYVKSGSGDASLNIKNVAVTSSTNGNYAAGVYVMSGLIATDSPNISLSVDGGSLTTSASEGNDGIQFYVGSSQATGATTSLTVSDNAIVDAKNGGISALKISETLPTPTPTGDNRSGIVFDGSIGTVYGSVTLQDDLEIKSGETLTIPDDSSLNSNGKLTNNGKIIVDNGGKLEGTINGNQPPKITTERLNDGTVNTAYNQPLAATGDASITWSVSNGSLPTGLTLESTGLISGTPTSEGTSNFTVTASNNSGSDSKELSITISAATSVSVTGVTLNKTELTLTEGNNETLTATVQPDNATNKNVTWSSNNLEVATVENGTVTAKAAGTATITVTTEDGNKTATCAVTVEKPYTPPPYIPPTYAVTVPETTGGTVEVSPSRASSGRRVTITTQPAPGYELESLTVLDSRGSEIALTDQGDGKYTFTMPSSRVTVQASFAPVPLPFEDVPPGAWYEGAVRHAYFHNIMEGMSATKFSPNISLTRAQAVQVLYNLEGQPTVSGNVSFPDLVYEWYKPAISWAESTDVVDGYEDGTFRPDQPVTRQEFAQMLYHYAAYKGYDLTAEGDLSSFPDGDSVQPWAETAMTWANGNQLINGHDDGTLEPGGTTTRAQAASILMRFDQKLVEN